MGKTWFKLLKINKINFVIRLKHGDYESEVNAEKGKTYEQMFLKCATKNKFLKRPICLDGEIYTFVMLPNPKIHADEPILLFLTTLADAKKAAESYVLRWKIECLFKHLKSNGFHLEDLNLKNEGKNLLMFAAAHLLYFVIKNHPFSDGNKRIGALLFVWFLERNRHLHGFRKINENALVALALLIAQSDPAQKEIMVKLVINLINR